MSPLVSVCIPAYNHEKYVEETILSVLNQTYKNFELLVIDDGSRDSTKAVIERLKQKHEFYFSSQPNQGIAKTLARFLTLAKGKYISYVASDDTFCPTKLERCVTLMEEQPDLAFCHGRCQNINAASEPFPGMDGRDKTADWCAGSIFETLLNRGCFVSAPTTLIRKESLLNVGGIDENLEIEDWNLWLSLAHSSPVGFIEEVLAHYRIHGENTYWNKRNYYRMYMAEKRTIDRWATLPKYRHVHQKYSLNWFYRLAVTNRATALKYAIASLPSAGKSQYWKAWLRFVTGETFSRTSK
jgi:alpha-1,3-rhamnosyltransferase